MDKADQRDFDSHYEYWDKIKEPTGGEMKKGCCNCAHWVADPHYSGGEQGWCTLNRKIFALSKMFDDICEDYIVVSIDSK